MERKLHIDPPLLIKWIPFAERSGILFLDIEPDFLNKNTIRLDLNIIFRPVPIRRGSVQTRDYYVGSTGARVVFEAFHGTIRNHSRSTLLAVDHTNTYSHSRKSSVLLCPKLKGDSNWSLEPGNITFDKDLQRVFTTKFSGTEPLVSDTNFGSGVEWEIKLPERQLIRDYLIGNLFLFVECSWDGGRKAGRIEVRPSDVLFFDSERRMIASRLKALVMLYVLWKQGIKLNRGSVAVNFSETE